MIKLKELIHNILVKPIVYPSTFLSKLIIAIILWVFLFSFMVIYTPFNLNKIGEAVYLQSMVYSSISVFILFLTMLIYPVFDKEATKNGSFTNRKYLVLMIITSLVIYIANHLYSRFINEFEVIDLGINYIILLQDVVYWPVILVANIVDWEVRKIVIIDLAPITEKKVNINALPSDENILNIVNNQNKVIHVLNTQNLICSFSYQNYVEIFVFEDGRVNNVLLRLTFNSFYDQIRACNTIIRCHRTRIINLNYLKSLVTNNGRKMVKMKYIDETMPVSRNYPIEDHFPDIKKV